MNNRNFRATIAIYRSLFIPPVNTARAVHRRYAYFVPCITTMSPCSSTPPLLRFICAPYIWIPLSNAHLLHRIQYGKVLLPFTVFSCTFLHPVTHPMSVYFCKAFAARLMPGSCATYHVGAVLPVAKVLFCVRVWCAFYCRLA